MLKRILIIATLGLFALAGSAFAENTTVSCSSTGTVHAWAPQPGAAMHPMTPWNGGGSNAMSSIAGTAMSMAASPSPSQRSYVNGRSAMRNTPATGSANHYSMMQGMNPMTQNMAPSPFTPWNGGGSNAMSNGVESLPSC